MSEHQHQCALFNWAEQVQNKYPDIDLMFAVPNGGLRNKRVAYQLKREGVKPDTPDVMLPVARGAFHGLFIEIKRPAERGKPAGKASKGQISKVHRLNEQGYLAVFCYGWEQAKDIIIEYMMLDS